MPMRAGSGVVPLSISRENSRSVFTMPSGVLMRSRNAGRDRGAFSASMSLAIIMHVDSGANCIITPNTASRFASDDHSPVERCSAMSFDQS